MKRWLLIGAGVFSISCGSAADPSNFPTAYAHAVCHFQYHCCTPAERGVDAFETLSRVSPGIGPPFTSFAGVAESLGYADEGGCDDKLGLFFRNGNQPIQTSVKDKRITWDTAAAQ